jgi:hypothetical protein
MQYIYLLKKYIKWGVWRVAVCPSYMLERTVPKVNFEYKTHLNFGGNFSMKKVRPIVVKYGMHFLP